MDETVKLSLVAIATAHGASVDEGWQIVDALPDSLDLRAASVEVAARVNVELPPHPATTVYPGKGHAPVAW